MARVTLMLVLWAGLASPASATPVFRVPETDTLAAFAEAIVVAIEAVPPRNAPPSHLGAAWERVARIRRASAAAPPVDMRSIRRAEPPRVLARNGLAVAQDRDSLLWFYGSYLEDTIPNHPDPVVREGVERRVQNVRHAKLEIAQRDGLRRLWRYEVKYGPGSARLNLAEVFLNASLQRLGLFAPGVNGPSPLEALLAYSTSYATLDDRNDAQAVSVLEAGLRRYTFSWEPEAGFWVKLMKPRYGSLGVALAGERDGALRWPLSHPGKRTRVGPFVTWGDLKVAMLLGPESRVMVSRQLHLLPNLF
ncbi:MAG TPA: hypothetical protein VGK93_07255 [Candidatus Eisenbacteria bacterium]|jgi:hypothetical protein